MTIEEGGEGVREPNVVDDDPSPNWMYYFILHGVPLLGRMGAWQGLGEYKSQIDRPGRKGRAWASTRITIHTYLRLHVP